MDSTNYKLRKSDFIPIKGWLDYTHRVDSPPAIGITDDLKNLGRAFILGTYNLVIISHLAIGAWMGLEKLISN